MSKGTPVRTFRCSDELWQSVVEVAADKDESVTDVIIRALKRYARQSAKTTAPKP